MCTHVKIYLSKLLQPIGWLNKHAANRYIIAIALLAISAIANAQIAITTNTNAQTLSQLLAGQGVTISNYTRTCDNNGSATFTNNATNLGLTQGVVLATGRATNVPNAANNFASNQFSNSNDAQLSTLTTGNIYDKCILEFDIVPQGNYLKFDYVFASEEYPEFVCSQFNDVFGFFISGPNPGGGNYTNFNIATIPNTTLPVCINAINPGISGTYNGTTWNSGNCIALNQTSYYTNNLTPLNPQIIYDGMTKKMTAIAAVTPCQPYHLKLAIADVGDRIYDSGVFLEAYSFTSAGITVSASGQLDYAGYTSAYEGCVGGTFRVSMPAAQPADLYVDVVVTGTATNGTDYTSIPTTVVIPAGQTYVNIDLNPLQDGIGELPESVTVAVVNPCTGLPTSSATLMISDNIPLIATAVDTTLCQGQSTQLSATGGATYSWTPSAGLSNPNIANPIASPTSTTTYIVAGTWGACTKYDTITIHVSNLATMLSSSPSDTMCTGSSLQINANTTGGLSPYTYVWSTGSTANNITVTTGGAYRVTITDAQTCSVSAVKNVYISNPTLSATTTSTTCNGNTGTATTLLSGANLPASYLWNDGNTQANRTGLSAASYTVTITDANGCTAATAATVGSNFPTINVSLASNNVSCFAGNNGSITTNISGGTASYTYNWSGGITTANRTNLSAGTYNLTVTDANGCSAIASATITQPAAALSASLTSNNVSCFGGSNGAITSNVSSGTTAYTYNWGGGITTANRTNLSAGTYNLTITDANGCSATASTAITQPAAALSASLTSNNISCFSGSNGAITTTVTGGTTAYTYNWGGGITTANRINLSAGTYNLTVTDANGCSATASTVITQPAATLSASLATTNVSCFGGTNGTITSTVSGGTAAYTYNWGGGITTANRTNLSAGTYNLTVTDANGCSASATTVISQPASALAASLTSTNVLCFAGNNGAITTTVTGGTAAYTYNWGGGITTANRTNLIAGTYNLTVTDANGCSATASATITQPAAGLSASLATTNVLCYGGNNGAITSTVSGGTAAYTYNWGSGVTAANRANLSAGTYNLTVTDANGCSATASTVITQPAAVLSVSLATTNVSCFAGTNGAITSTVSGGTAAYTYNWGGGITTANRTNLSAGTYNLTVTDANGCSASATTVISQPASALVASLTSTNVLCFAGNNGAITTTVTGGTAAYTYNWGGGITTANHSNLSAGTYNLTVTDANGCSASASSTITQPAALSDSLATTNVPCFGGTNGAITTTVTGGTAAYTYNWGGGITTANRSNLSAGTYNLTVTDANGCSASASSTITQPAAALSVSLATTNVPCFGGTNGAITTTVTGGTAAYTYNWGGGITTANRSNLSAGTYNLTVTDANGCSASTTTVITQPASALSASLATTNVSCFVGNNGAITSTVSGGTAAYTYNWGGGITTANRTNLSAGTYNLTITDANGCSASASSTITQPASALAVSLASNNVSCFGGNNGTIATTVNGGTSAYTYNWGGGITSANRTNLSAGAYSLTVTDANSCSASTTTVITQPVAALSASLTTNSVSCFGGSNGAITSSVSGGTTAYTYNWSGGITAANRTNLSAGTYNLTVTDANGCSATASTVITQPASALSASLTTNNVSCFGGNNGAITSNVSGGTTAYTYNWSGGITTANRTNLSAGAYSLTVTDANGCSASASSTITQPASALAVSLASNNVSCFSGNNGTIATTVNGGTSAYTYNWGGGITTANRTNLSAGTYNLTVTDANGCSATASTVITQPAAALSVSLANTNVSCFVGNNGAITSTVSGGTAAYTYNWGGGITSANRANLSAGTYTLTVTDANACSATASTAITQPAAALSVSLATTNVPCFGGNNGAITSTVSGGTAAYTYNWGGGIATANRTNLSAGTYNLTITDANGCSASASSTITQPASALAVSLASNNVSCFGGNNGTIATTVNGGTAAYTYNWGGGITTANRANLSAGTYNLTVTDANACSASASSTITQPAAALSVSLATTNVPCFGGNNGAITSTVTGGTTAYTYNWGGGITTANRTNLSAGTYNLTITDANGCSASASSTITQPASALSVSLASNNVSCFGGNNGTIATTVNGGTSAYTYNWGGGITTANRTNLSAGTYNLTVIDANGCSATASTVITQPASALSASLTTNSVSCFGGSNGAITSNVSGGTTAYTYNWGGGITTANRTNLSAGAYSLTITDANGCSATASATITQPAAALSASLATNNVSCFVGNNGAITSTVSGGTAAYTYNWGGGITTANRTNLSAGTYNLTVTDANGCSASASAVIAQPAAALSVALATTNVSCFVGNNGAITSTVSGGTAAYTYNWSGGITTANRTNLSAGTYNLTVTDANGCSASASAVIAQPAAALSVALATTNVSCFVGNNGAITSTVSGGTAAYTYNWSGGITTANRTNLIAGSYNLTVTDANACSATVSATITQPAAALSASLATTNVSCFAGTNGAITSTVSGGTTAYTYNWGGGITTANRTNLSAGTYNLTVTDANGCSATASTVITQPAQLTATAIKTDVACNSGTNGSITINANGGIGPYAFAWSHNSSLTSNIGVSLPAGYYNVSVTDVNQCNTVASATITQPTVLSVSATPINVLCAGGTNGSIATQVSGGAGTFAYLWSDNITTASRNNMRAGTYGLTVTDANGCNNNTIATITQPDSIKTTIQASNVSCYNGNNGAVTVSVTGGITPYTYAWSHNQQLNTNTSVSLPSGYYTVSVKDANNCSTSAAADITQPFALTATATQTNVSCNNGNDGAISVYANGGTAPYTYSWSHNNQLTTSTSTTLPAGYFSTSITDANNCSITIAKTITQPVAISTAALVTDATCFGSSNGSVSLNVAGGTPPYTYGWSNGQQNSISNSGTLPAGYYTVSITDDNGCASTLNYSIAQPAAISLSATPTAVTCFGSNNGSVMTTCTGGTLPYTYRWNNNSSTPQIQNLIAATYTVTVTDNQQCTAETSVQVAQPNPIAISLTHTDISCNNNTSGSVNTNISGGTAPYNYTWSNGQTSQNMIGLHTGSYTLTVTDANNCTSGSSVAIIPTSTLPVTAAPVNVTCYGFNNGKVNVAINGGVAPYIYHWNTGSAQQNLQALPEGVYTVTVTDQNSCSGTATANVVQPTPLDVSASPVNVQCHGVSNGSVTVVAQGGTQPYSYDWDDINGSNDPPVRTNIAIGTYKVTVIDSNQCMANAIAAITAPMPLSLNLALHNPACYGDSSGAVSMNTSGGTTPYNYNWSNNTNQENLTNVPAGAYAVDVTDYNGCSVSASVTLNNPAQLLVSATHSNTSCFGGTDGTIDVSVVGGATPYAYHWNDNSNQANRPNVSAGMYVITVTDINGCDKKLTVPVSQPQAISISPEISNIACYGENNGSITLITNGGNAPYTYTWNINESANSIAALQPGTYQVTVTDNNNCTNSASYQITQPLTALQTSIGSINNACFSQYNGSVNVIAEGGTQPYTYHWNTGGTQSTLTNLSAGYYEVTITDANGCIIENSAPVIELPELKSEALISNPACKTGHGSIDVTISAGASPYAFTWSNGNTNEDITQAQIGNYSLTITDANGCTYKEQYRVEEDLLNPFTINAGEDTTIKLGETVLLNGITNAASEVSMIWALPAGLSCTECATTYARPVRTTTYTVTATDENGCTATDEVTINITPWGTVFIPNAFSPNGDGNNDTWEIFGSSEIWQKVEILIFNRWGEKVYETTDINGRWDGMYKGEPAPQAVYVYVADITYIDGRREADLKGSLTLVR